MNPPTVFPNGARCAISLTYDDGLPSHLDDVAPTLERCGLRGTFNVPIANHTLMERTSDWRDLAARGHELGNHSLFHPCRSTPEEPKPWLDPAYNMVDYNERRLREELEVANFALKLVDGRTERTFANTCCHTTIGSGAQEQPIEPILADYFLAARGALTHRPVNLADTQYQNLGSGVGDRRTFAELRAEVEALAQTGGWLIYMLHGVGEGTHNHFIQYDEHRQLVEWLGDQRDRIWTAPMIDVVRFLRQ